MKKLILSLLTMASLAFAANAVTYLNVKTDDGKVVKYDVESVAGVYYKETSSDQGVTVSGKMGKFTYVDLGLPSGTKWATYNVGATMPTDYGYYFAWGETEPKEEYNNSTYKWSIGGGFHPEMSKYAEDGFYKDNKTVLEAEDDAATANWGSAWRMPTWEEIKELLDGCSWEWVEDFNGSGVNGRLGTSKVNGSTIFLPAAGYLVEIENLKDAGDLGYYWSSSLDEITSSKAYYLFFNAGDCLNRDKFYRYRGQTVRAVLK